MQPFDPRLVTIILNGSNRDLQFMYIYIKQVHKRLGVMKKVDRMWVGGIIIIRITKGIWGCSYMISSGSSTKSIGLADVKTGLLHATLDAGDVAAVEPIVLQIRE